MNEGFPTTKNAEIDLFKQALSSTVALFSTATSKSLLGAALQFTKIVLMYLDALQRFLLPRLAPFGFRFLADEKMAKVELRFRDLIRPVF